MTAAVVRKEITISPGEVLDRNAEFEEASFPAGTTALDSTTVEAERKRGTGTLTVSNVAAAPNELRAGYRIACSADASTGSIFLVTATGGAGQASLKVTERVVVIA